MRRFVGSLLSAHVSVNEEVGEICTTIPYHVGLLMIVNCTY